MLPEVAPSAPQPAAALPRIRLRRPRGSGGVVLLRIARVLLLLALFMLGFVVYMFGLSSVAENRVQNTLFTSFVYPLSNATAPVGSGTEGDAVAVLSIPKLGLNNVVVVEGTASGDLSRGPGHVVASALPGQAGVCVIYGKVATFGAPFAHLMRLNRGDLITLIAAQGPATYKVSSFGDDSHPAPDTTPNRLVLMTANSNTSPNAAVQLTADLQTEPQANPGHRPAVPANQKILANDVASLIPLMLWSQALLLVSIGGSVAAHFWSRWPAYLCAAPVVIAVAWNVYENLAGLLPNVY